MPETHTQDRQTRPPGEDSWELLEQADFAVRPEQSQAAAELPPIAAQSAHDVGATAVAATESAPEPAEEYSDWVKERLEDMAKEKADDEADTQEMAQRLRAEQSKFLERNDLSQLVERYAARDKAALMPLMEYLEQADPAELVDKKLDHLWKDEWFRLLAYRKIAHGIVDLKTEMWEQQERKQLHPGQEALITKAFEFFGVGEHADKIVGAWREQTVSKVDRHYQYVRHAVSPIRQKQVLESIGDNFSSMEAIERQVPGGVKQLHEQDGICNFRLYGPLLVQQLRETNERPDVVMLSSTSDWFGGRGKNDAHHQLSQFYGRRGSRLRIRIKEASDPDEAHERLQQVSDQFGPIKNLILWAHMGGMGADFANKTRLSIEAMRGTEYEGQQPFLDNTIIALGGRIIVQGCDAGEENGVGHALADTTGARVYTARGKVARFERKRFGLGVRFIGEKEKTVPLKVFGPSMPVAAVKRVASRFARKQPTR
ncbi:MAG TPA: hypothetical protein VLF91_01300 [Candidatus Saccharimonadales bacterium]|nr:hypothetical protein [Candidatus Saccharimonadales bacterium]